MSARHWRRRDHYYRLLGVACSKCGAEYYPPVHECRKCGAREFNEKEMPSTGRVVASTALFEVMDGFEDMVPLNLALIQLDNGVKVLGQIVDSTPDKIKAGDRVTMTFRKISAAGEEGQIYYGYKFVKARE